MIKSKYHDINNYELLKTISKHMKEREKGEKKGILSNLNNK